MTSQRKSLIANNMARMNKQMATKLVFAANRLRKDKQVKLVSKNKSEARRKIGLMANLQDQDEKKSKKSSVYVPV